jgi:hypothetical protein
LPVQLVEDGVGIAQTTHQKAPHDGVASGRSLDPFFRQQQNPRLHFAKMTFLHRRQRR